MLTKCDVLTGARAIAARLDHIKGSYIVGKDDVILSSSAKLEDATGCCMLGAMILAIPNLWVVEINGAHHERLHARLGAEQALMDIVPGGNIARFNDDPETTKDMVVEAFDKAIANCECPKETIQ